MAKRRKPDPTAPDYATGNFVSEWFGHRVFPTVSADPRSLRDQQDSRCPFLTEAIGRDTQCVKAPNSQGVCTISSVSNGPRQDWLVCPLRAVDQPMIDNVARRLFRVADDVGLSSVAGPTLADADRRERFARSVQEGNVGIVFLQSKLGGEISISATDRSPELSFDTTLVQVIWDGRRFTFGRYGVLELQTMDYHGTYRHAVANLRNALSLHVDAFPRQLQENQRWLSQGIEGPNIANVFKRTFYQVMLKFQIGGDESCAGCMLALPASVWDSWQPHLGAPELQERRDGTFLLGIPDEGDPGDDVPAWIYVFDLDQGAGLTPNPIVIQRIIATNADAMSYFALKLAPEIAVAGAGERDRVMNSIRRRLAQWWPELGGAGVTL